MRLLPSLRVALVFSCYAVHGAAAQHEVRFRSPDFLRAAAAVVAVNGVPWTYNRYVRDWDWSHVGPRSWWENLRSGFQWDDDALTDNQLAHPLHGSLYYNAARGAGYSFWGSAPFVALGSLSWEFLAENVRPSANDVLNTTFGGIALGEVTSRLATLLASRGSERVRLAPRLGAVLLDPVGSVQGWLGTERASGAPGDQVALLASWFALGAGRALQRGTSEAGGYGFLQFGLRQGNLFDAAQIQPFDAFEFGVELIQRGPWELRRLHASGLLVRSAVHRAAAGELAFGLFQHYEFAAHPIVLSGQSVSGALLYRRHTGRVTELDLGLHLEAIFLGEIASEQMNARRRDYDYASGLGARFESAFREAGRDLLGVQTRIVWLRTVYGADARHLALTVRLTGAVPLGSVVGVGGEAFLTWRRSAYPSMVVDRWVPEVRAYLAWPVF
jgi:hypothetical protein